MKKLLVVMSAVLTAAFVFADSFPEPVGGVMTINISSDVTYTEALPATVTQLIKTGAGKAILTVDSTDFAGAVDVQQGTLQINTINALGTGAAASGGSQVTVSASAGAATFHIYKPVLTGASKQTTVYFGGHNLTIAGAGVDGNGAFIFTPADSGEYDCFIDSISLSADASIGTTYSRWGVKDAINLNGHTLSRVGSNGGFITYRKPTVNAGKFVNKVGLYTMQTVPDFTDPTHTSILIEQGELRFWRTGTVNVPVTFLGGSTMRSGANNDSAYARENENVYAGGLTADVNGAVSSDKRVYVNVDANTWMIFNCPLTLKARLCKTMNGLLRIKGDILGSNSDANADFYTYPNPSGTGASTPAGTTIFEGDNSRTFHDFYTTAKSDVKIQGGTLNVHDFVLRSYGRFFQEGGTTTVHNEFRAGNADGVTVFRQTGGVITNTSYDVPHFGVRAGSSGVLSVGGGHFAIPMGQVYAMDKGCWGMLVQTGGVIRGAYRYPTTHIGRRGDAFAFVGGGTNDSYHNQTTYVTTSLSEGGGKSQLVISGSKTRFETDSIAVGCSTNAAVNVLALVNGGSLRAMQLYKRDNSFAGSHFSICADNGTLMPTRTGFWCNKSSGTDGFINSAPDAFPIFSGGLTIDTSECCGEDRTTPGDSYMNFAFSAPTGRRIASITLPTSEEFLAEGYFSEKMLEIVGPADSYGACAYVAFDYDKNTLGPVNLLCGGCNYDETTKIYIRSANQTKKYECAYTLADQLPGGGLTKKGANIVYLYRPNTYVGATRILGGRIRMAGDGVIPAGTALEIAKGAALDMQSRTMTISALSGSGNIYNGGVTTLNGPLSIKLADLYAEESTPLTVSGTLTFGTGSEVLSISDREDLAKYVNNDKKCFLSADVIVGTIPQFVQQVGEPGRWRVVRRGNKLYFGPSSGLCIMVK